ncbi:vomeronasal type-2 receptor 26-like [Anomaloglossus baeobatrachus]
MHASPTSSFLLLAPLLSFAWRKSDGCLLSRQISYGATDPSLSDRRLYPHVFRTVQDHRVHNLVITRLLKHFGWTWVGILVSDDENGEKELQILRKYMREDGICEAFTVILSHDHLYQNEVLLNFKDPQVRVLIMCGTFPLEFMAEYSFKSLSLEKTFIFPPSWIYNFIMTNRDFLLWNGSLAVEFLSEPFPGVEDIVQNYRKFLIMFRGENLWRMMDAIAKGSKDSFISFNWTDGDGEFEKAIEFTLPSMRTSLSSGVSPRLYYAVEVLGKALHEMFSFIKDKYEEDSVTGFVQYTRKLQRYIQMLKNSPDPMKPSYYFNEEGEAVHPYKIVNWVFIDEATREDIRVVEVGHFTPWAVSGEELHINPQSITWKHTGKIPVSRCSDPCSPGSWKKAGRTIHPCCYDCVPCSEGEISNMTDADKCIKCSSSEWPNEKSDRCLPKVIDFISYQKDPIASVFSGVSLFGCLVTGFIFGIFISYRDTPIVRANNRNLSYLLLVSIFLSFLSGFLFLGRPTDVTCRLRETSFGIFFSVAISSLLAKTIMVCVAFKSTKLGSQWRRWLSVKLPYTIVLLCSSLQVVICAIWLSISPPFKDLDTESYPGTIIIQCNEGSDLWFCSMLGYLGLLAAVSFVLAFMVRTLPDSFNEAKFITFSMLVFISVWIAMIPAYLSTRGKSMVAVEVFAVMASSAGLLGCVFFPKCFIILFRSERNRKTDLLRKSNERL